MVGSANQSIRCAFKGVGAFNTYLEGMFWEGSRISAALANAVRHRSAGEIDTSLRAAPPNFRHLQATNPGFLLHGCEGGEAFVLTTLDAMCHFSALVQVGERVCLRERFSFATSGVRRNSSCSFDGASRQERGSV